MVTVRNDGNTLLTAGTIDLYREGSGQPFSSASIGFGANARMASIYDPELAEDASANDMAHVKYALETLGARFATAPAGSRQRQRRAGTGLHGTVPHELRHPRELERRSGQTRHAVCEGA